MFRRTPPDPPNPPSKGKPFVPPNSQDIDNSKAIQFFEEARVLGALDDPVLFSWITKVFLCPADPILLKTVNDLLQPYRLRNTLAPDCFRPYPGIESGLDQGDVKMGIVHETEIEWCLDSRCLTHALIVGPTGAGKTNACLVLFAGLSGNVPYVFVSQKDDIMRLLDDPPLLDRVLRWEELKLSLFAPPPGMDEIEWGHATVDLFCRINGLHLSGSLFHDICDELRPLYQAYSAKVGRQVYFTPRVILAKLETSRNKYADSITAAMKTFCWVTGDVFEHSAGYPLDALFLGARIGLIIDRLKDENVARFVVELLQTYAYEHLYRNGPNDGSPQLLLALDDGHRFLSKAHEKDYLTPLSQRYLIARQAGLRLLAVSHCPNDLSPAVLSQSGLILLVGGLVHEADIHTMGAALGLDAGQRQRLNASGKGEFIARENSGRYNGVFGGMIHPFPPQTKPSSEADRRKFMAPFFGSLHSEPAVPLDVVQRALGISVRTAVPARMPVALSANAHKLALDILAAPWDFLNTRYVRLKLAGGTAQRAKQELLSKGCIKEHHVPMLQGNSPILLEPLTKLASVLGQPLPSWSKGGFVHAFMQQAAVAWLSKQGHANVRTERFFGSKAVDVVATDRQGRIVGVEVTNSFSNLVDNIEKDFLVNPQFALITVLCLSSSDVNQAERAIQTAPGLRSFIARIRVEQVAHWL